MCERECVGCGGANDGKIVVCMRVNAGCVMISMCFFFFQAEDGIRDCQ